jgi:thymidylate synthase
MHSVYQPDPTIFASADMMWAHAIRQVHARGSRTGSRDGQAVELLHYSATLGDVERSFVLNPARALDPVYAAAEILWYLSGDDSVEMIRRYAPQYDRFANDGRAYGAYGRRVFRHPLFTLEAQHIVGIIKPWARSQLHAVVEVLKRNPESRQAQVSLWDAGDLAHAVMGDKNDLPCTSTLQFFVRGGRVCLHAHMRSNDLWLGYPYDIYAFTAMQRLVATALDRRCGSLHYYERNATGILASINEVNEDPDLADVDDPRTNNWCHPAGLDVWEHASDAVRAERMFASRESIKSGDASFIASVVDPVTQLGDLVRLVHSKHLKPANHMAVRSPILAQAVANKKAKKPC